MNKLDQFMFRQYKSNEYECWHFACDVWRELTGEDLTRRIGISVGNRLPIGLFKAFERLLAPITPCIVYMTQQGKEPHTGIFIRGNVFHLNSSGPEFMPLSVAARNFTELRFYK